MITFVVVVCVLFINFQRMIEMHTEVNVSLYIPSEQYGQFVCTVDALDKQKHSLASTQMEWL